MRSKAFCSSIYYFLFLFLFSRLQATTTLPQQICTVTLYKTPPNSLDSKPQLLTKLLVDHNIPTHLLWKYFLWKHINPQTPHNTSRYYFTYQQYTKPFTQSIPITKKDTCTDPRTLQALFRESITPNQNVYNHYFHPLYTIQNTCQYSLLAYTPPPKRVFYGPLLQYLNNYPPPSPKLPSIDQIQSLSYSTAKPSLRSKKFKIPTPSHFASSRRVGQTPPKLQTPTYTFRNATIFLAIVCTLCCILQIYNHSTKTPTKFGNILYNL